MGKPLHDLTGQKFNRWTVIRFSHFQGDKPARKAFWFCRCKCGTEKPILAFTLTAKRSQSCGCYKTDHPGARTHGLTGTSEYSIWWGMMQRCYYPKAINYRRYGARGIKVCKRWHKLENFVADMGMRPSPKHQLDRIDNSHGYNKKNCRWATARENGRNRRDTRMITFNDETKCLAEWAERLQIPRHSFYSRLRRGYAPEQILQHFQQLSRT